MNDEATEAKKLLVHYLRMAQQGGSGLDHSGARDEIEKIVDLIIEAALTRMKTDPRR